MRNNGNRNLGTSTHTTRPFLLYLLCATIYLGVQMFQGLSYNDIGMYMSGYKHFVSEPYASYFLGQWFLSYDLTAYICKIFDVNTFLGLRIMHLIYVLASQTTVYFCLRRYIPQRDIIIGLLLCTLAHYGSYTEINYNDYSALLLLLSIIAFHKGVIKDKAAPVFLAGTLAGIAIFFRIVNITYIGIPVLSCIISTRWRVEMKAWRRLLLFYIGMAVGIALALSLIKAQGYMGVMSMTLSDITNIACDNANNHSMVQVIQCLYNLYAGIAANAVFLFLLYSLALIGKKSNSHMTRLGLLTLTAILTMLQMNFSYFPSNTTMAICIIGAATVLFGKSKHTPTYAHLMLMSLYLPLVLPFGSNAEPVFYGKEICFLTLPMAIYELDITAKGKGRSAMAWMLSVICFGFMFFNIFHKQMEEGNRISCRHTIDRELTRGILTTSENANMYNHLIAELSPRIPKGSYMICTFSLPMVPILDCKPWGVFYATYTTDAMNDRYIDVAWQHTGKLPYLLIDNDSEPIRHEGIIRKLNSIKAYREIWTDGRYSLLYPQGNEQAKMQQ